RAEDRAQLDAFTLRPRPDLGGDLVQGVLRLLKKDQARGPTLDDLSRKLRADRSARPADQDALITDIAVEQFLARGDDVPTEQLLDDDGPDVFDVDAPLDQVADRGDPAHAQVEIQELLHDHPQLLARNGRLERQGRLADSSARDETGERVWPDHRSTTNDRLLNRGVIVDEGDESVALGGSEHRGQLGPRFAGAV